MDAPLRGAFGAGASDVADALTAHLRDALLRTCQPRLEEGQPARLARLRADREGRVRASAHEFYAERQPRPAHALWTSAGEELDITGWKTAFGGEFDVVLLEFCIERDWRGPEEAAAPLAYARALLAPRGVVVGVTLNGDRAAWRAEEAVGEPPAYVVRAKSKETRMRLEFRAPRRDGDPFGRALRMELLRPAEGPLATEGPVDLYAVCRDHLALLARAAGLVEEDQAAGLLSPTADWDILEWWARTGEPLPAHIVSELTLQDWNILASFAVFAFKAAC